MFTSDLTVLSNLGFPLTAKRIQEELTHSYNSDNIIEWAFDHGYKINKSPDYDDYTEETNRKYKWSVERSIAPYCGYDSCRNWYAPTAKEAISFAYKQLQNAIDNDEFDEMKKYKLDKPFWIKE